MATTFEIWKGKSEIEDYFLNIVFRHLSGANTSEQIYLSNSGIGPWGGECFNISECPWLIVWLSTVTHWYIMSQS